VRPLGFGDDLDIGTGVDVWDHKHARDMNSLLEDLCEVVSEQRIVAPPASIYDEFEQLVADFPAGLPARVRFSMWRDSDMFDLVIEGQRTRQVLLPPIGDGAARGVGRATGPESCRVVPYRCWMSPRGRAGRPGRSRIGPNANAPAEVTGASRG
jgi:hypothetical protein